MAQAAREALAEACSLAGKLLCVLLAEVTFFYLIFAKLLYIPLSTGVYFKWSRVVAARP
jgi:hypothetical protein